MSKFTVTISRSGDKITFNGLCLKSDLWEDWKFFFGAAERDLSNDDRRSGNRNLRAALLCLFGHLEGSINDFIYQSSISNSNLKKSIQDKCNTLSAESGIDSPVIKDIKKVRNIVVHPGGKKDDSTVFDELSCASLEEFGNSISDWLDALSNKFNIPRFPDTKRFTSVAKVLGMETGSGEI